MAFNLMKQVKSAFAVSVPLLTIQTPDPFGTVSSFVTDEGFIKDKVPMLIWDCARGLTSANQPYGDAMAKILIAKEDPNGKRPESLANPVSMLLRAQDLAPHSILFMMNLHRFLERDPQVIQCVCNLRDKFKEDTRMLVVLCPSITLVPELAQDMLVLDEPLPDANQLAALIGETYTAAEVSPPNEKTLLAAVDASLGLAAFPAEQVYAQSIKSTGLDLEQVWSRKRQHIAQTPGLSVYSGSERFKDIGGCENAKNFLRRVINGRLAPRAIVFQDEIEKAFGGSSTDLSGTTQELLGYQLMFMQDHNSTGILSIGPAGVAKTAMAKALGNEAGIPTIQLDLGGAKGSLVGQSGANMRMMLKVIEAVSQGLALWIATTNDVKSLPPELRRRFSFGSFFYDLPTAEERESIWKIYIEKFQLAKAGPRPNDAGWTGAEIKNCCDMAFRLGLTLREAALNIVPISVSASERILALRKDADGRFISASTPGPYRAPANLEQAEPEIEVVAVGVVKNRPKRKIDTGGDVN